MVGLEVWITFVVCPGDLTQLQHCLWLHRSQSGTKYYFTGCMPMKPGNEEALTAHIPVNSSHETEKVGRNQPCKLWWWLSCWWVWEMAHHSKLSCPRGLFSGESQSGTVYKTMMLHASWLLILFPPSKNPENQRQNHASWFWKSNSLSSQPRSKNTFFFTVKPYHLVSPTWGKINVEKN